MSANRFKPHVLVLPEDDANRQLANGFALAMNSRQIQILKEAGGWGSVIDTFERDHVPAMRTFPTRSMILLIDFDEDADRLRRVRDRIPADLVDRVFIVGSWSEPEALRKALARPYEEIGRSIADGCLRQDRGFLQTDLLKHNLAEIDRACVSLAAVA